MKKTLVVLLLLFCTVVAAVVIAKDTIAKAALRSGLSSLTGCALTIDRMKVGLLTTDVDVTGLRIANPQGFSDPVMADIPELFIDYDLGAFLKGAVHLTELRLYLKELVVVRNPGNALNLSALKGLMPHPKGSGPLPKVTIDLLVLRIGKVQYREYGAQLIARDFILNLDERIKNVTDPKALLNTIIARALSSGGLAALTGMDIAGLQAEARQAAQDVGTSVTEQASAVKQEGERIVGSASDALQKTADDVKKLFQTSK